MKKPFNTVKDRFSKISKLFNPFKRRIESIEKHLGLDVASYFNFSYWFIYHNLVAFGLTLLPFVCIPHIIMLAYNSKAMKNLKLKDLDTLNGSCVNYSLKFQGIDILVGDVISPYTK